MKGRIAGGDYDRDQAIGSRQVGSAGLGLFIHRYTVIRYLTVEMSVGACLPN